MAAVRVAEQDAPVSLTDRAKEKVNGFMESRGKQGSALRVGIAGRSSQGFRYAMNIVDANDTEDGDVAVEVPGFLVYVDERSVDNLRGAVIDFVETDQGAGFQIENPNPVWRDETAMLVQNVIDSVINPGIASHGGYVELLGVQEGVAYVEMGGGCQGCGLAAVTLKQGVESTILDSVPGITAVVDHTDHASGTNPFYQPSK